MTSRWIRLLAIVMGGAVVWLSLGRRRPRKLTMLSFKPRITMDKLMSTGAFIKGIKPLTRLTRKGFKQLVR
jgi:hypothetical protein